ncbi:MAG: dTMP kinase [Thermoleophilia bacterium]|nr:dTMP kinase [Thermoleophilia bacterium]
MDAGLLISFEGIDGCGKTTQLARLVDRLAAVRVKVLVVREPGGTRLGEQVRGILLDPATGDIDPAAEALLYAASRAELVATVIEPALAAGQIVVCDRYVDSSLAYQGAGRGLGIDRVLEANLLATRGRLPDLTVLVDLDPAVARTRLASTGADQDRIERAGSEFFTRAHAAYGELAARWPDRILRIDGDGTADEVEVRVDAALSRPLAARTGIVLEPLHRRQPA